MSDHKAGPEADRDSTGTLFIRTLQKGYGQEEVSETGFSARYVKKGESRFLLYREEEEGKTDRMVRILLKDKELVLRKRIPGTPDDAAHLCFQEGAGRECRYLTPAGLMKMESRTRKMVLTEGDDFLKFRMNYSLYMEGELISDYRLTLRWTEDNARRRERE